MSSALGCSNPIRQLVARLCVVSVSTIYRQVLPQATIFRMIKERWAQIGITTEFLIVVRTLGEFFRLRHVHGTNFSTAVAALYLGGALIAACSCWAGVTFYFLTPAGDLAQSNPVLKQLGLHSVGRSSRGHLFLTKTLLIVGQEGGTHREG